MQEQLVSYTAFLQPQVITENNYELTYTYGADYERIKGILKQNNALLRTRYYTGAGYEKDLVNGGATREIHYIDSPAGLIAIVVRENGTDAYHYVYTDHLGSILTVTDAGGSIEAEQNFDAWGRRRNTTDWSYAGVVNPPDWLYRGYTGHEMLDPFVLINMNGRIYDPVVGRVLSPDNYVQDPFSTQGFNRYSYGFNNPLRYTDPDGNNPILFLVAGLIGGVKNVIDAAISGKIHNVWQGLEYFGVGFVGGAVTLVNPALGKGIFVAGNLGVDVANGYIDFKNKGLLENGLNIGFTVLSAVTGANLSRDATFALAAKGLFGESAREYVSRYLIKSSITYFTPEELSKLAEEGLRPSVNYAVGIAKVSDGIVASGGRNIVYTSVEAGVTQYVGITNNLAKRAAQHLGTKGIKIEPLMQGLSRADARAVEQALIEVHGLSKNGGTLINLINSISPKNPAYGSQLKRGFELLKSIGYL